MYVGNIFDMASTRVCRGRTDMKSRPGLLRVDDSPEKAVMNLQPRRQWANDGCSAKGGMKKKERERERRKKILSDDRAAAQGASEHP